MWLREFKKRNPDLRLKSSESVMKQTVANARKDILSQYFELLEQILIKNNLRFKPHLIFNCDLNQCWLVTNNV